MIVRHAAELSFEADAAARHRWQQRNAYYYRDLEELLTFLVPAGSSVLELGCGFGHRLARLAPSVSLGVDRNPAMIAAAKEAHPHNRFATGNVEHLDVDERFDYVLMVNLIGHLQDVSQAFSQLKKVTTPQSRVIITYYNHTWEPLLKAGEAIGMRRPQDIENWLNLDDIENLLYLNGYEVIRRGRRMLLPRRVPVISRLLNAYIAPLPIINRFCMTQFVVAKEIEQTNDAEKKTYSTSIIIPTRDEAGNIDAAIERTPEMGKHTEFIFVDGNSTDGTVEKIEEVMERYRGQKDIKLIHQGDGRGKGDAVRKGFAAATGDILIILDSDLTTPPEDMPKFYEAIANGRGEFINGSRLVYPMEKEAMRFLNKWGNRFFSWAFTWLLDQRLKDTLCGTKVLFKRDYEKIAANRSFFGDFDPFGDFDLLFGASKLCLKIVEIPVRYRERTYGEIKIQRFTHGLLLLRMCVFAARKLKFRSA